MGSCVSLKKDCRGGGGGKRIPVGRDKKKVTPQTARRGSPAARKKGPSLCGKL